MVHIRFKVFEEVLAPYLRRKLKKKLNSVHFWPFFPFLLNELTQGPTLYVDRTATTHIMRQLISGDNSYHILKSNEVLTDANLQSINSSLKERLGQFDHPLVTNNIITPNER